MEPAKAAETRPSGRVSVFPILAVNFVGTLGFSIVLPFLVFLVTQLGGNALVYGVMGATYSFFQLLGAPVLGRWSDRYGRRRILLLGQVGTLISWGIFLVALWLPLRPIRHETSLKRIGAGQKLPQQRPHAPQPPAPRFTLDLLAHSGRFVVEEVEQRGLAREGERRALAVERERVAGLQHVVPGVIVLGDPDLA
jgi:hypothetical protein